MPSCLCWEGRAGQTGREKGEETLPGGSEGASSGGDIEFRREEDFLNRREEGADPGGQELERRLSLRGGSGIEGGPESVRGLGPGPGHH